MPRLFQVLVLASCVAWCAVVCAAERAAGCLFCGMMGECACAAPADGAVSTDGISASFRNNGQWPQPGGDGTPVTITYSYNNFLNGGLKNLAGEVISADYLRLVTEEAFGLWAGVAPLHFIEVPDIGADQPNPPVFSSNATAYRNLDPDSYGQIRINHLFINGTDEENGFPTTKARAWFPSVGPPIAGDIQFDNGDPWEIIGGPSTPDVLGIMTHEIGHSIGLVHSAIEGTVMFPAALRRNGPGTGILLPDDIARVRAVYGEGVGSVTPLVVVPEPAAAALAAAGMAALACRGRRRREKRRA